MREVFLVFAIRKRIETHKCGAPKCTFWFVLLHYLHTKVAFICKKIKEFAFFLL